MEIIEETSANWLVQHDDGATDIVGKSNTNKALIDHNLWGLLRDGSEVLVLPGVEERSQVTVVPDDDARSYTLSVGDYEGIHLGPHQKSRLVDAIIEGKESDSEDEDGAVARSLIALYDSIREKQVRSEVVGTLSESPPFSEYIEDTADGWLIHDHLLLTWEGEFYHPETTSYTRSGSVVEQGSSQAAYQLSLTDFAARDDEPQRELTLNGKDFRLTDAEMEFIAKALWGIEKAPREGV